MTIEHQTDRNLPTSLNTEDDVYNGMYRPNFMENRSAVVILAKMVNRAIIKRHRMPTASNNSTSS